MGALSQFDRRKTLKCYTSTQLMVQEDTAETLANVVQKAALLLHGTSNSAKALIEDLEMLFVSRRKTAGMQGQSYTSNYSQGFGQSPDSAESKDRSRLESAVCGLRTGYQHQNQLGNTVSTARQGVDDEGSVECFDAMVPIGRKMNDRNLVFIGSAVRSALQALDADPDSGN